MPTEEHLDSESLSCVAVDGALSDNQNEIDTQVFKLQERSKRAPEFWKLSSFCSISDSRGTFSDVSKSGMELEQTAAAAEVEQNSFLKYC